MQAQLRAERGWTLDDWAEMSLAAKYDAIAEFSATAVKMSWDALGEDGQRKALMRWREYKRRRRESDDKSNDSKES